VPGLHDNDRTWLEASSLGGGDELTEPALLAVFVREAGAGWVGVDLGQGREVVVLAEPTELAPLPPRRVTLPLFRAGEAPIGNSYMAGGFPLADWFVKHGGPSFSISRHEKFASKVGPCRHL